MAVPPGGLKPFVVDGKKKVEAAAIEQGYGKEDIFVTGHSLGGWEAAYVAQQTGVGGIAFESPGLNSTVAGNGADSGFVNILTYEGKLIKP